MRAYSLADFAAVPSVTDLVKNTLELADLPSIDQVKTLATWPEKLYEIFSAPYTAGMDRSARMAEMSYLMAEAGWSDEQMMTALQDVDDRWGKYRGRSDRGSRLVDLINRARQKYGYAPADEMLTGLLALAASNSGISGEQRDVYGYLDFLESEFHVDWLLEGLFASGGLGLVTGYPGTGKTQLCLQIAHYLALGYDSFLRWQNVDGRPRKVMFLSLEMSANPLHLFLSTIAREYDADSHELLQRNLMIVPTGIPVPLDTKEGQTYLNHLLDEYHPDVLIVDSMQKIISNDLTDEQSVKKLIHYLALVRKKYEVSMLVIHHNRKKSNDGQRKEVELSDVYGSTYLTTDVDFVLSLRRVNSEMLSVDLLKNRLGPTVEAFEIYRNENLNFSLERDLMLEKLQLQGALVGSSLDL